jgi:hypothetical protein
MAMPWRVGGAPALWRRPRQAYGAAAAGGMSPCSAAEAASPSKQGGRRGQMEMTVVVRVRGVSGSERSEVPIIGDKTRLSGLK